MSAQADAPVQLEAPAQAAAPAQPVPVPLVKILDGPKGALIGGQATFLISFENGGNATGYAPFLDLALNLHGADGNAPDPNPPYPALKCDGISFAGAALVNATGAPPITTAMDVPADKVFCTIPPTTTYPHALTTATISVPLGHQLLSLPLPVGSFAPSEPALVLQITVNVSDYADDMVPLSLYARGGFQLGDDPVAGAPITSHGDVATSWESTTVTPVVLAIKKEYLGPEGENATGGSFTPVYPLRYKITAEAAPGQTITNLKISDKLPANQAFGTVTSLTPGCTSSGPGATPANGAELVITCASPPSKVEVEYEFHTPYADANGSPVVNLNTCEPSTSINDIAITADWDPLDPRDPLKQVFYDEKPDDHILTNKCGAIQKTVELLTDHSVDGPTPADILRYTLRFQVSDFLAMGDIQLEDWLADGQDLITSSNNPPRLEISDRTHPTPIVLEFEADEYTFERNPSLSCGGEYPDTKLPFAVNGVTRILFDVSKHLIAHKPHGSASMDQGVLVGGGNTGIPGMGKLIFHARIRNDYTVPQTPGNRNVDKHDPVCNQAFLRARRAQFEEVGWVVGQPPIEDDSKTVVQIPGDKLAKSVYARNGVVGGWSTGSSTLPQFAAEDEITFQIEKTDLVGDGEAVRIEDWLPQPVLSPANLAAGPVPLCSGAAPPALDTACYYASPTTMGIAAGLPALSKDPFNKSFSVNFGDLSTNLAQPHTLGLRVTLKIAKKAYKDGLHLTNVARECENNTFGITYCQMAMVEFEITAPKLRITKGLVWAENPQHQFVPNPVAPVPFNAPPACPAFLPHDITSGTQIDYDLNHVDALDKIKYVIVVENYGMGVNGAYDVKVQDSFPPWPGGKSAVIGVGAPCVSYGNGTPIPGSDYSFVGLPSNNPGALVGTDTGFSLELHDPGVLGALPPPDPGDPGANVLVISYDLTIRDDIAIDCYYNTASIMAYANTDGGATNDNYVTAGQEPKDFATFCVLPKAEKHILGTSEAHTTPQASQSGIPALAVGEIVHYHLRAYVPEGSHPKFQLLDLLPPDLIPLNAPSGILVAPSNKLATDPAVITGGPWTCDAKDLPPKPLQIDLGTVSNPPPNGPQPIMVDFYALVCNTAANVDDTAAQASKVNEVRVVVDGTPRASAKVEAKIVEPRLQITKTMITPITELQAGQTLEYRIEVKNPPNGVTAFDLEILDPTPACLKGPILKSGAVFSPSTPTANVNYAFVAGKLAHVKVSQLVPGQSVAFTYTSTVDCLICDKLKNTAQVIWTSLPGKGTPSGQPGNGTPYTTPGLSGDVNGERNHKDGPGGVNDYVASAEYSLCGKICGWKWHDKNKDGVFDPDEVGLNGWVIGIAKDTPSFTLLMNAVTGDKPFDPNDPNNPNVGKPGWYCQLVLPGNYNVAEKLKAGWVQTHPKTAPPTKVSVGPGEVKTDVNFGNYDLSQCKAKVCGFKYLDANGNGQQDPGETGINGWTIEARKQDGTLVATAVTANKPADPNNPNDPDVGKPGWYCLELPGEVELTLSEVPQAGYTQTAPGAPGTYGAYVIECPTPVPEAVVWPRSAGTLQNHTATVDPLKASFGNRRTAYCTQPTDGFSFAGPLVAWGWTKPPQVLADIGGIPATVSPVVVPGSYKAVSTGPEHTVALDTAGHVHLWGHPSLSAHRPKGGGYVAVAAGDLFTLALHKDGYIDSWGASKLPGHDLTGGCVPMPGMTMWSICSTKSDTAKQYTKIAAGWGHSLALFRDNDPNTYDPPVLQSWGLNSQGVLPGCTSPTATTCVLSAASNGEVFHDISAGAFFSLARGHKWTFFGWGVSTDMQHPGAPFIEGSEPFAKPLQQLAGGVRHSLGIWSWPLWGNAAIKAWGQPSDPNVLNAPAGDYFAIAAGHSHSMALDWNLHLAGWGQALWVPTMPPLTAKPYRYAAISASGQGDHLHNVEASHGVAIGCQEPCGQVCGTKYLDADSDGQRDYGEPVLAGWTMRLRDGTGKVLATAKTDGNGRYCLTLPYTAAPTSMTVEELIPANTAKYWFQTGPGKNATYTVTTDCSTGIGVTACLTADPTTCGNISPNALDFGNRFKWPGPDSWWGFVAPSEAPVSSAARAWPAERLIDGKPETVWSSSVHGEHLAWSEWAGVRLNGPAEIRRVRLYPRSDPANPGSSLGFPKDFVIQYSQDGDGRTCDPRDARFTDPANWRGLVTKFGFPQPTDSAVDFDFEPVTAGCVRVFGAELSQDDYGNRFLQLAEIMVQDLAGRTLPGSAVVSSASPSWPAARLVDGKPDTVWSSKVHGEHLAWSEWAAVRLTATAGISRVAGVRLIPRADPADPGGSLGFPKDFVIQHSRDGGGQTCDPADPRFTNPANWRGVVTKFGFPQPANAPVDFRFAPQQADCVRVFGAELSQDDYGNRFLQLAELMVLSEGGVPLPGTAAVSSASRAWPAERLVDGDPDTVWSSNVHGEHLAWSEWAAVRLPEPAEISRVRLYPRSDPGNPGASLGFPKDFVIQHSQDGGGQTCDPRDPRFANPANWRGLVTRFGFPQPTDGPVDFEFAARTVGCVRIFGAELSQDDYGNRFLQLGEIELSSQVHLP